MSNLVGELKKRNVLRAGGTYAVVTWGALQVADTTFAPLGIPEWVLTPLTVIAILGFPVTILVSWFYEWTPDGILTTAEAEAQGLTAPTSSGRLFDFVVIALLGMVLAYVIYDAYVAPELRAPDEASIAVLPFVNMSSDPEQEYFSDGISEELLNVLAKVPGLRVAARTSSFSFKGLNENIQSIGEKLHVAMVLEGSVRKAGSRVRITAQLIKVADGYHLWSETYERELTDIFAIQDDIARAIAAALEITLLAGGEQASMVATSANPEAHDFYLLGLDMVRRRAQLGADGVAGAVTNFERAVELDPGFAPAWAGLAESRLLLPAYQGRKREEIDRTSVLAAIDKALALDPRSAEAYTVLGAYRQWIDGDLEAADTAFVKAIALNPNSVTAYAWRNRTLSSQLRFTEAMAAAEMAFELDPFSSAAIGSLSETAALVGDNDRRYALQLRLRDLGYDFGGYTVYNIGEILMETGRIAETVDWIETHRHEATVAQMQAATAHLLVTSYLAMGDVEGAATHASPYADERIHLARGETEQAVAYALDRYEKGKDQNKFPLLLLIDTQFYAGNLKAARDLLETLAAETRDFAGPLFDIETMMGGLPVISLAYLRRQTGDPKGADALVAEATRFLARLTDGGFNRPSLHSETARLAVIKGDMETALSEMRMAIDKGWRLTQLVDWDPIYAPLRAEPRFQAMMAEVKADLARQYSELKAGGKTE